MAYTRKERASYAKGIKKGKALARRKKTTYKRIYR